MRAGSWRIGSVVCITILFALSLAAAGAWGATLTVGTGETYATIQAAINAAVDGDVIIVDQGTYKEQINFNGKNILIRSTDPDDGNIVAATIIDGTPNNSPTVTIASGETTAELRGMKVISKTGGTSRFDIYIANSSTPIISKCFTDVAEAGIRIADSSPLIVDCNIDGSRWGIWATNSSPEIRRVQVHDTSAAGVIFSASGGVLANINIQNTGAAGLRLLGGSSPAVDHVIIDTTNGIGCELENSTTQFQNLLVANASSTGVLCNGGTPGLENLTSTGNAGAGVSLTNSSTVTILNSEIAFNGTGLNVTSGTPTITFSDVYGNSGGDYVGIGDQTGTNGNISADPLYVSVVAHDWHEQSLYGHWDQTDQSFELDAAMSPCIDAGDPASPFGLEVMPNGGRVNQGYFGNTAQASLSKPTITLNFAAPDTNGVDPDQGSGGTTFTYKVVYQNNGDFAPVAVKVWVIGPDHNPIAGSPFGMTSDGTTDYVAGVTFSKDLVLTTRGWYAYYFVANDGFSSVKFPALLTAGPLVDTSPVLTFTGEPNYVGTGLAPYRADAGSTFEFRVKYSDADGDAPVSINLRIWNAMNGVEIAGSPFTLAEVGGGTDWVGGEIYHLGVVMGTAGIYQYAFKASDGIASDRLPDSGSRILGPRVNAVP